MQASGILKALHLYPSFNEMEKVDVGNIVSNIVGRITLNLLLEPWWKTGSKSSLEENYRTHK